MGLLPVSLAPFLFNLTGPIYLVGALILGLSLLAKADLPILALGFHGYVLFLLFMGWKASMELKAMARGAGR